MRNNYDSHHLTGDREGQPAHKDYQYSPVSASIPRTVDDSTALQRRVSLSRDVSGTPPTIHRRNGIEMTERGSQWLQYIGTFAGNLAAVVAGVVTGWTSPVLPMMKLSPMDPDNPVGRTISDDEGSWIGSMLAIGAIIGGLAAGYSAERFGRKRALLFSAIPFVVGWILVTSATTLWQIYIARLVLGFAIAFTYTVLPMYVGEISEPAIRGALGSMMQLFITVGLLFSYGIGPYISYRIFGIACLCVPIVFFVAFFTLPESPYYLLSKGEKEDASKSMAKLRGKSVVAVQKEVDEMQAAVEEAYRSQGSFSSLYTDKVNLKALMLCCALVFFQQFTGINVILFYTKDIFDSTGSSLSAEISTIIVGVVMLIASVVTPLVADRLGRKVLLMISGVGSAISIGVLGLYFFLQIETTVDTSVISVLPVICLVVFISVYSIGWGPLPWAIMGELFAADIKSKASSVTVSFCWILTFLITKFYTNVESAIHGYGAFWIFTVCSGLSAAFVFFLLPETKGKTLEEIQRILGGAKLEEPNFGAESTTSKK